MPLLLAAENVVLPGRGIIPPQVSAPASSSLPSEIIAYAVQGGSSNFSTSKGLNTTGATLIILVGAQFSANYEGETVFSDTESNTWTQLPWSNTGSGVIIAYCINPTTSATHKFTFGGGVPTDPSSAVVVVKGYATLDVSAQEPHTTTPTTETDAFTGRITPTEADFVLAAGGSPEAPGAAVAVTTAFKVLAGISAAGGSKSLYIAYYATNETPPSLSPYFTPLPYGQGAIAAFKPVQGIAVVGQRGYAELTDAEELSITVTTTVPVGNTLFCCVKLSTGAYVNTVSTTGNNTWTLSVQSGGAESRSAILHTYVTSPLAAGAKVVIHPSKRNNMAGQLIEASGLATTSLTHTTYATAVNSGVTQISVTGTTAETAPQLALSAVGDGTVGPATWAVSEGWTIITPTPDAGVQFLNSAYKLLEAVPSPVTVTWTNDTQSNLSVAVATYKGKS